MKNEHPLIALGFLYYLVALVMCVGIALDRTAPVMGDVLIGVVMIYTAYKLIARWLHWRKSWC